MLANMPNGNARRKFGQGLPPVSVTLKKITENGRDSKSKFEKFGKKRQFFSRLFIQFPHLTPLQKRQTLLDNIAVLCGSAPSLPKKLLTKKCQKMANTPILAPKIVILVNKKCFNQKTSAGTSSYIIIWWPHAKFEANRMVQL